MDKTENKYFEDKCFVCFKITNTRIETDSQLFKILLLYSGLKGFNQDVVTCNQCLENIKMCFITQKKIIKALRVRIGQNASNYSTDYESIPSSGHKLNSIEYYDNENKENVPFSVGSQNSKSYIEYSAKSTEGNSVASENSVKRSSLKDVNTPSGSVIYKRGKRSQANTRKIFNTVNIRTKFLLAAALHSNVDVLENANSETSHSTASSPCKSVESFSFSNSSASQSIKSEKL